MKQFWKPLLFPHIALLLILLPVCTAGLLYFMGRPEGAAPVRIALYALSFYTLTLWCLRVPEILRFFKNFREENRYMKRWLTDVHLRTNVTLSGNAAWNVGYAALQLGLGIYHSSPWFYALAAYYASLAVMRFFLVRYTLRHKPGEKLREEWRRCRACGWVFLVLNAALTAMIFYMVARNKTLRHHEITTIAMAAYSFASLTMAILNVIRYRKLGSPAFSASRVISLASACVSMLTLEETMLTTFGSTDMPPQTRQLFLAISGGAISAFILVMAICLIVHGTRQIRNMENKHGT